MKVGLGIPGVFYTEQNLAFARQVGATHIVAHFAAGRPDVPLEELRSLGYFPTYADDERYTFEGLRTAKQQANANGLELLAVENFEAADWHDVLLDGPLRDVQMKRIKEIVRDVGANGISTMGYNFTIAGVWGRPMAPSARGGAMSATYANTPQTPIPKGMVWNSVYDLELYERSLREGDYLEPISSEQLWDRYTRFLLEILPVAEEAGVTMALHPDDPPLETLRDTPRLIFRGELYERMLALSASPSNAMEFCVGTLSEMPDQDIYEIVEKFVATDRIRYVHLRNVIGRVPDYREEFIDEGYVDMQRILRILHEGGFDGVVIPDHTPFPTCDAPWHAGMAYALGWIRASMRAIGALEE